MSLWGLTDANISKPKYLDRGQIVALNVANGGTYTAVPAATIQAPASGTQATATAIVMVDTAEVNVGGTGWAPGDIFTVNLDDTAGTIEATFQVTGVDAGAVTDFVILEAGSYVDIAPVSLTGVAATLVSGSDGADLTVDLTLTIRGFNITNPGSGYKTSDLTGGAVPVSLSPNGTDASVVAIAHPIVVGTGNVEHTPYIDSTIVFVDREESLVEDNRYRGLLSPGWWLYSTYVDGGGMERHRAELLVAVDVPVASSGDAADDETVPEGTITIAMTATAVTLDDGDTGDLEATVTSTPPASLTLKWQVYNGSWGNVTDGGVYSGSATDTLTLTAPDFSLNGKRYRLKVSGTGFRTTYSVPVTLTITPTTISFLNGLAETTEGSAGGSVGIDMTAEVVTDPIAGLDVTYVWDKSDDDGETWTPVEEPTPDPAYLTVGILAAEDDGDIYRCTVSRAGATSQSTQTIIVVTGL